MKIDIIKRLMNFKLLIAVFMLCLFACNSSLKKQSDYCNCPFTLESVAGTYEEYYHIPEGDNRFWLEKVLLVTDSYNYGLGIPYRFKESCSQVNTLLAKKQVKYNPLFFYAKSFYPKYLASEVSNTTNLFYNIDSSRIIIAFNVRMDVLMLKNKADKHCDSLIKKMNYSVYNSNDDVFLKNNSLGLINGEYIGNLSTEYISGKKYTPVKNINSFYYETGD